MSPVETVLAILLIPAGILPIVTAWYLRRYRDLDSQALRDRWHVALVMALVGTTTAFLAANRLFDWGFSGSVLILPFGIALLLVDLVSGKWLLDYYRGAFAEQRESHDTRRTDALERTAVATERIADTQDEA